MPDCNFVHMGLNRREFDAVASVAMRPGWKDLTRFNSISVKEQIELIIVKYMAIQIGNTSNFNPIYSGEYSRSVLVNPILGLLDGACWVNVAVQEFKVQWSSTSSEDFASSKPLFILDSSGLW